MSDTTSIDDLPTDPSSGNQNNITIQKTEMNNGMRGGGGGGGVGGMAMGGNMMTNQMQPPAQVYSPNISGVNMGGGGMGGGGMGGGGMEMGGGMGMGMGMPQQMQGQGPGQGQQNMMNELVNGLQRASASGMTNLPSRDIPMNTMGMMSDPQVKPNYVPQHNTREEVEDYINRHEKDAINEEAYLKQVNREDSMENIYKLIQIPLLVSILYFAFQLPIFRKYVLKYIPSLFNADGNYNISGLVFVSVLFGSSYFGLTRVLDSAGI
jgi:hypothetical protein